MQWLHKLFHRHQWTYPTDWREGRCCLTCGKVQKPVTITRGDEIRLLGYR